MRFILTRVSTKESSRFTRYPMLGEKLREDGKYTTGMMVYVVVWEKGYSDDLLSLGLTTTMMSYQRKI